MEIFNITHPQAANAIRLANAARFAPRATITHQLHATKTPRARFTCWRAYWLQQPDRQNKMNGSVIKATWVNRNRSATYWCPASKIPSAFRAFPLIGEMRVELEIVKTCARRPAGVDHHINDYL